MSALEPGLYRATVRGVPDQIVMLTDSVTSDPWIALTAQMSSAGRSRWFTHDDVTDARPLTVLDLHPSVAEDLVEAMRDATRPIFQTDYQVRLIRKIADAIEVQTKPARIPEPGWGGVVTAIRVNRPGFLPTTTSKTWLHDCDEWVSDDEESANWSDLIDPTLVREGIEP